MSCYCNPNYPVNTGMKMPLVPYGTSPFFQVQPPATGMTPTSVLPTGIPSGPPYGGVEATPSASLTPTASQPPQTVQNPYYLAGKLREYIGRDVRVEFLIGTGGSLVDRIGTLLEVGASYIIIRPVRTDDQLVCDLYSIKFVTVYA